MIVRASPEDTPAAAWPCTSAAGNMLKRTTRTGPVSSRSSVTEPSGTIPPEIEAFLTKLEQHGDYADRTDEIRAMITAPASDTPFERTMRTFGYTRSTTALLGGAPTPLILLPPNITYNLEGP